MKRVLVAGELNPDLVLQGYRSFPSPGREVLVDDFVPTLGSASAICAVGLARLGTPVAFLSRVGDDVWGRFCVESLRREGVDVSRVRLDGRLKTGVTVSITSRADRALVTFLGSIAALRGDDIGEADLDGFAHLHVSSYYLQTALRHSCREVFARAHAAGLTTSLDPGFDPDERWEADIIDTLTEVDLFFPNDVELAAITRRTDPVNALEALQNGRTTTVAKLGADGCLVLDGGVPVRAPAFAVDVVDTTGAGDSFDAGFLHGWLQGWPLARCLRYGAACGALSTRQAGGTPGQPAAAEADRLVEGRP